jgi:hypothetical protein
MNTSASPTQKDIMKTTMYPKWEAVLLVSIATIFALFPVQAADSPPLVPFQGHLARPVATDPQKFEPVPNGQYDILFTLYAAPVGGESKVWGPERHTKTVVVNGLVNAFLGSVIGFANEVDANPNFLNRPLYVGITIDVDGNPSTADLELVPRQVMLPAVQALNAGKLDGSDWPDFFVGTDQSGKFIAGSTKAKDADLLDGIDTAAVFVDPSDKSSPKVKRALTADAIAGSLNVVGNMGVTSNLTVSGTLSVSSNLTVLGSHTVSGALSVLGNLTLAGKIQSEVESVAGGTSFFMVPRGSILIWSGAVATIPAGWALCDGANGTPDLRSRFVLGFDGVAAIGSTGGTNRHNHTVDIPAFDSNPGIGTSASGSGGGNNFGSHYHTINPPSAQSSFTTMLPPYIMLAYIMKL